MSAGMAEVIAAHSQPRMGFEEEPTPGYVDLGICVCGAGLWPESTDREDRGEFRAAHVAEELTKAGYGKLDPLTAALNDQEGHALVKAIHDRKAEG